MQSYKYPKIVALKFLLLAIFTLNLTACGFTPMYADNANNTSSIKSSLDQIDIALIPDRSGQYLRNELIDRFYISGMPSSPRYSLKMQPIRESISNFDITLASEATRQQIKLSSTMTLVDLETGKSVLSKPLTAITSNNILESEFSTLITEQSAREAALNDLARQIERQLALYFNS